MDIKQPVHDNVKSIDLPAKLTVDKT